MNGYLTAEQKDKLANASGELAAAIMQSIPSDDQIIMDHVRAAHETLRELLSELL